MKKYSPQFVNPKYCRMFEVLNKTTTKKTTIMKIQETNKIQSSAKKTFMFGQVFVDVTPKEVYDYLDSLDENDIVERTKYDFSI